MSEPFLGEIIIFAGNFAPRGFAFCEGQLLQISQNQALFSLLGTMYGGDGRTTFALPDLRGRGPVHTGQGPGLGHYVQAQRFGVETVTLTQQHMPGHTHSWPASSDPATTTDPTDNVLADTDGTTRAYGSRPPLGTMPAIAPAGGGLPHENMQPFIAMYYCIALQGVFPSRN